MTFTAIDFETAHADFPCEIGLTKVIDGEIVATKSWLIKPSCFPYMNYWNQRVHGISNADLKNAQNFEELWNELKPWLDNQIVVAHNAAFDMRVLRSALLYYELAILWIEYFCSVSLSRKVWKDLSSHSLGAMCEFHNIKFNHHRAGEDAKACAIITLKALNVNNSDTIEEALKLHKIKLKRLNY